MRGEIIMVPVANPPGLAQLLLNSGIGRFDLASGRNFNRDFPDLAALAQPWLPAESPATRAEYLQQVRDAMQKALAALPVASEVQALRQHLLSLACDADLVLDLHCDDRGDFAPLRRSGPAMRGERTGGFSRYWRRAAVPGERGQLV
ncbi:succinylglutamate desuccinylase/aspartoacylase family protein [Klebsiella pneumoniae]|nr:succinylglutamate desuccinylase/aspartoacylase family protein [Klebsiella pneumoniae]